MSKSFYLLLISVGLFYSCISHKKSLYLRAEKESARDSLPHYVYKYKLQPKDELGIHVTSFNKQVTEFYNVDNVKTSEEEAAGFPVNDAGYIHLPMMDSVFVKGKTIVEVQNELQKTMREQVSDALVLVRLVNFKITLLGEVRSAGLKIASDDEITVFEAIAMGGDLTEFANTQKVNIIREKGKSFEIITININERDILSSPNLYIQPNDVIYVEPLKVKIFRANLSQIGVIIGFSSLLLFILNYFKR